MTHPYYFRAQLHIEQVTPGEHVVPRTSLTLTGAAIGHVLQQLRQHVSALVTTAGPAPGAATSPGSGLHISHLTGPRSLVVVRTGDRLDYVDCDDCRRTVVAGDQITDSGRNPCQRVHPSHRSVEGPDGTRTCERCGLCINTTGGLPTTAGGQPCRAPADPEPGAAESGPGPTDVKNADVHCSHKWQPDHAVTLVGCAFCWAIIVDGDGVPTAAGVQPCPRRTR